MPLETVPDMLPRAVEIDDPTLLVHRVLYRQGKMANLFRDSDPRPLGERKQAIVALAALNRADLLRLEELLETVSV